MVVAHPDDETLWAGGLVLRHPGDWTIVCCSVPVSDPVRAERFVVACERLAATPVVRTEPDRYGVMLSLCVDLEGADVIVTHGAAGEYGHPHHVQVSRYVRERARVPVLTFGYLSGTHRLTLTADERAAKLHALTAYDHVLPYQGTPMPKWRALLMRYGERWLDSESYD